MLLHRTCRHHRLPQANRNNQPNFQVDLSRILRQSLISSRHSTRKPRPRRFRRWRLNACDTFICKDSTNNLISKLVKAHSALLLEHMRLMSYRMDRPLIIRTRQPSTRTMATDSMHHSMRTTAMRQAMQEMPLHNSTLLGCANAFWLNKAKCNTRTRTSRYKTMAAREWRRPVQYLAWRFRVRTWPLHTLCQTYLSMPTTAPLPLR